MPALVEPFSAPFMQLALAEITLLAIVGSLLGAPIVLRRLAFFSHGVGAAAFPGLVVAGPLGVPPQLAALGVGAAFAGGLERLSRRAQLGYDAATALLLVAALGIGIVLASDVYESSSAVDQLLFGTLLGIGASEIAVTGGAALLVAAATAGFGRTWTATGFDASSAPSLGLRVALADWVLLLAIAVAVVAAVDAVGALLVSAVLVIPAATARLFARSVRALHAGAFVFALGEGVAGLWLAYTLDVPPGPAIAVLSGAVFALAAVGRAALAAAPARPAARASRGAS